jgi:hypothetical protein
MTTIRANEWILRKSGKLGPVLSFDPVAVKGKEYTSIFGHSFLWVVERGLGVNALVFLDVNEYNLLGITHVNIPRVPSIPYECKCMCGNTLILKGRDLYCPVQCTYGRTWIIQEPISWLNVSIWYPSTVFTMIRGRGGMETTYFLPRKVQ